VPAYAALELIVCVVADVVGVVGAAVTVVLLDWAEADFAEQVTEGVVVT